jgi:hypothetical protein
MRLAYFWGREDGNFDDTEFALELFRGTSVVACINSGG